jgi:hypothetical protein
MQLKDYLIFIVIYPEESTSSEGQKISYHIIFDLKHGIRHKAILFAGVSLKKRERINLSEGFVISSHQ